MENYLKKAFDNACCTPKECLAHDTWCKIVSHEKQTTRIKLWFFSSFIVISLIVLVPAYKTLSSELSQSGFYDYISLAFSNGGSIIPYWKDFLLLLVESLPGVGIILVFSVVFVFFISVKYTVRQINRDELSLAV